jgi:hypothetical protein
VHRIGKKKTALLAINLLLGAGLLFVGLWPFRFMEPNRMSWNDQGNGLRSGGNGAAFAADELSLVDATHDAFSLELVVESFSHSENDIGRILSIVGADGTEQLFIGEWQDHLVMRFLGGSRELDAPYALRDGKITCVSVTYGHGAVSLFVDGAPIVVRSSLPLRSLAGSLVLGKHRSGGSGWVGQWLALRISRSALSRQDVAERWLSWQKTGALTSGSTTDQAIALYSFSEQTGRIAHNLLGPAYTLSIPENVVRKSIQVLHLPFDEFNFSRAYLQDVALNSVGFIPMGYCCALFLLLFRRMSFRRLLVWTTVTCGLISLTIEVTQAFMPSRTSQLSDLILNTAGGLVGAIFCVLPLALAARGK